MVTKREKLPQPVLTVDFVGLVAFALERKDQCVERVHVLLLDPQKLVPGQNLCRHDPYVVLREKFDNQDSGKPTKTAGLEAVAPSLQVNRSFRSFQWERENFGFWDISGRHLQVTGVRPDETVVRVDSSCGEVLDFEKLGAPSCTIEKQMIPSMAPAAVQPSPDDDTKGDALPEGLAASFLIEHGRLSAHHLTGPWYFGPHKDGSVRPECDKLRFPTVVRWQIYGDLVDYDKPGLRLAPIRSPKAWMALLPGSRVVVSNLCPLDGVVPVDPCAADSNTFKDVLAYYELARDRFPKNGERNVFYDTEDPNDARPGSDPCSPFMDYIEEDR